METVLSKCYRTADGYYRVQIVPDPDCESPRDANTTSLLVTWESSYGSPDNRAEIPGYLIPALNRWCGGGRDFSRPVQVAALARYCRAFLADRVYAVASLQRNPSGRLQLDRNPDQGSWCDGFALVTRDRWTHTMGVDTSHVQLADEILCQELAVYNAWQDGENYGYEIERFDGDSWVQHESCYGLIGEPDGYVLQAAMEMLAPDRTEVSEDDVRSAVIADPYLDDLAGLLEGFRFENCEECQEGLDRHIVSPDMFGKPHAWCVSDGRLAPRQWLQRPAVEAAIRTAMTGFNFSNASTKDVIATVGELLDRPTAISKEDG